MLQVAQSERTWAKRNLSSCKTMLSCHSLPHAQWASEESPLQILHSFKVLTSDQRSPVKDQGKKTTAEAHLALQSGHVRLGEIPLGRTKIILLSTGCLITQGWCKGEHGNCSGDCQPERGQLVGVKQSKAGHVRCSRRTGDSAEQQSEQAYTKLENDCI